MTIEGHRAIRTLARDARGASYVEYAVLVGIVALVGLGGARVFGRSVQTRVASEADCVATLDCARTGGASSRGTVTAAAVSAAAGGEATGSSTSAITAGSTDAAPPRSVATRVVDFGKGVVVDGAWGTVTGVVSAVAHPIRTVSGIGTAVRHPVDTAVSIKDHIAARWHENPERLGGAAAFEVATLGLVVGKGAKAVEAAGEIGSAADTAGGAAKVANAANAVDRAAETGKLAKGAEAAGDVGRVAGDGNGAAHAVEDGARATQKVEAQNGAATVAEAVPSRAPTTLAGTREAKQALDRQLASMSNEALEKRVQQIMDRHNGRPEGYLEGCTETWNAHDVDELKRDFGAQPAGMESRTMVHNWAQNLNGAQSLRMQLMNKLEKMGKTTTPDKLETWWTKELDTAPVVEFYERLKSGRIPH